VVGWIIGLQPLTTILTRKFAGTYVDRHGPRQSVMMGPPMAMSTSAMDAPMATTCPEMQHAPVNRLLCAKHCASDASAPTDARPLSVPPNLLTALPPVLPVVVMHAHMAVEPERLYRLRAPPPPASLLFCSLLI